MNTIIEILIDTSQSMGYGTGKDADKSQFLLPDGSTRMSLVKKILINDIIPIIDYASIINIRTFRSVPSPRTNSKLSPEINLVYSGKFDKDFIAKKISEMKDPESGRTPITAAINAAVINLKGYKDFDKKIFMLTDGQENEGGDYKLAVKKVIEIDRIPCQIFIVGINQSKEAIEKSQEIAKISGGLYVNIPDKNYESTSISSQLSSIKTASISGSINAFLSMPSPNIKEANEQKINKIEVVESKGTEINNASDQKTNEKDSLQTTPVNLSDTKPSHEENDKTKEIQDLTLNNASALQLIAKHLQDISSDITLRNCERLIDEKNEFIENEELNEEIRQTSEKLIYDLLNNRYPERVIWLNENGESFNDCDFHVKDVNGTIEYFIECKATKNKERQFLMTPKEWSLFLENTKNYQIYFISEVLSEPQIIKVDNLLDWILKGKIVPYTLNNLPLKAERIVLTII